MCAFQLPYIIGGWPVTQPELQWMLVGEKLADSGGIMYGDVWDSTGPLASFVYYIIHSLFGRSILAYRLLALMLILIQAVIFNSLLLRNKAYPENTYVPALFYAVFSSFVVDMLTLSPVLLGLTFLLLAINSIFKRIDNDTSNELFLGTGLYMGFASLCYLPYFIYFVCLILALALLSSAIFRRILLVVQGYMLVLLMSFLYYHYYDIGSNWWSFYVASFWNIDQLNPMGWSAIGYILAIPVFILLIAIFKTFSVGRFVNFQSKFLQVFLLLFVAVGVTFAVSNELFAYQFLLLTPVLAFFVTHYLLILKKRWQAEIISVLILITIFSFNYTSYYKWFYPSNYLNLEATYVNKDCTEVANNTVVVLGEDMSQYCNARLATPFLNWQLSEIFLESENTYKKLDAVYSLFLNDLPIKIVDPNQVMPKILPQLPLLDAKYNLLKNSENTYILKQK
jgi:hypothetical protein